MVVLGWGKMPFSHLEKPRRSVLTLRRKLHSSQFDLARSRWRSGGQEGSDMKRSVIVISPEGGLVPDPEEEMVFEPPELAFEPEDAVPLGVLVCWDEPPRWSRRSRNSCGLQGGTGRGRSQANIGRHLMLDRRGRGAKEVKRQRHRVGKRHREGNRQQSEVQGTTLRGLRI